MNRRAFFQAVSGILVGAILPKRLVASAPKQSIWRHIAVIYNQNEQPIVYVDGVNVGTQNGMAEVEARYVYMDKQSYSSSYITPHRTKSITWWSKMTSDNFSTSMSK